jgi:hypothetical protein
VTALGREALHRRRPAPSNCCAVTYVALERLSNFAVAVWRLIPTPIRWHLHLRAGGTLALRHHAPLWNDTTVPPSFWLKIPLSTRDHVSSAMRFSLS